MVQCEGFLSESDPFARGQIHVIDERKPTERAVTAQYSAGGKSRGRRGYNDGFINSGGSTQRGGAKSVSRWGESCWGVAKLGAGGCIRGPSLSGKVGFWGLSSSSLGFF